MHDFKSSPWITAELKKLISLKHTLFTKAKRVNSPSAWLNYKQVRNKVKNLTKSSYWSYVNRLFAASDNKRSFWCFVRDQRKSNCPAAFQSAGKLIHKPDEIAQAFNDFFTSVHSPAVTCTETPPSCSLPIPELPEFTVTFEWLTKALSSLSSHKAPGPDTISSSILRAAKTPLVPPLLRVMNSSLMKGSVPKDWKLSQITAVFKAGSRNCVTNYRPVALTSVVCKVLERAIAENINKHVNSLCLVNEKQHGFTSKKSCVTQLINATHDWASILDKPHPPRLDIIFLDFSKAFDLMPHHILLNKLARNFNIRGPTWNWLKSFLTNRQQRVTYRGSVSSWAPVASGVPQGSVLGPLLFNLFISDISKNLSATSLLFADDTLIYRPIKTPADEQSLQSDLSMLNQWSTENGMRINKEKSKVMHMSRCKTPNDEHLPLYTLQGSALGVVSSYYQVELERSCQYYCIKSKQNSWFHLADCWWVIFTCSSVPLHIASSAYLTVWITSLVPIHCHFISKVRRGTT